MYTWKEPWDKVLSRARRELISSGLSEEPVRKGEVGSTFLGGVNVRGSFEGTDADLMIAIQPGQNRALRRSVTLSDGNSEWVTVIVQRTLDESWPNVVRYTLFPVPD